MNATLKPHAGRKETKEKNITQLEMALKSVRVHLSPGSSCGLVACTLRILAQWYTFFMGHTAIF